MGIAIKLSDLDFSENNLGQVTFLSGHIQGLSISGVATIESGETSAQYSVVYNPATTDETDVIWSVVTGREIASINENGLLTVVADREPANVVIRATSIYNQTIYSDKTISVAGHSSFYAENNINILNGAYGTTGKWQSYESESSQFHKIFYSWTPLTSVADGNYAVSAPAGYSFRVIYSTDGGTTNVRTDWLTSAVISEYLPNGGNFALVFKKGTGSYVGDPWELDNNTVNTMFPIERVLN